MVYVIKFVSKSGANSDVYWPGDEESARRHAVEQVQSQKQDSAEIWDENGHLLAHWPDDREAVV